MRPDGPDAQVLADLKGRDEAVRTVLERKGCPPAPELLGAARAAALPVAVGERLVYEERPRAGGPARETVLRVVALRRDGIEFAPDEQHGGGDGARWRQDPFGNLAAAPSPAPGWLHWRRLLGDEMELGSVLTGDLVGPHGETRGRLRGQVIAVGVQSGFGRPLDAAVIELFGEASDAQQTSTRLDGVMVVDRKSGLLLRLDLRSHDPDLALRRVLQRIEAPAAASAR
jgi:hypothetical protein